MPRTFTAEENPEFSEGGSRTEEPVGDNLGLSRHGRRRKQFQIRQAIALSNQIREHLRSSTGDKIRNRSTIFIKAILLIDACGAHAEFPERVANADR